MRNNFISSYLLNFNVIKYNILKIFWKSPGNLTNVLYCEINLFSQLNQYLRNKINYVYIKYHFNLTSRVCIEAYTVVASSFNSNDEY